MNAILEKFKGLGYELRRVQREADLLLGQEDFCYNSEDELDIRIKCIGEDEFVMMTYVNHGDLVDITTGMGGFEVANLMTAQSWCDRAFDDMQYHLFQGDISAEILRHLSEELLEQLVGDVRDLNDKGQEVLVMAKLLR
jgi:hypothetical protein